MTKEEATEMLKALNMMLRNPDGEPISDVCEALDMAIEALTNVQNIHKGKWIKKQVFNPELDKYVPLIECSVCGYNPYYGGSEPKFNYCANCGARMKGGDSE